MQHFPWARKTDSKQREFYTRLRVARFDVAMLAGALVWCVPTAWCVEAEPEQDSGSKATEYFGNGAEINVIVHDGTGNPISSTAMVRLFRDGNIPSGEGATSHGRVRFVVTSLGEFTVVVEPAGQPSLQKDVSVRSAGETQVDVFLRPSAKGLVAGTGTVATGVGAGGTAGKMILAPKAQEAFDKGLRALSAEKMHDAEKFVGEAARLAPGHPDVLYVQGVLYLKEKNWSDAQATLEKATQIDPSHARAFAALGMALTDQGKFGAAIAPLEKSVELEGATANWETEFVLGRAYYESAKYSEALAMSRKALADSKGRAPEIALLVAQALTANGEYAQAEGMLKQFVTEHGDRPEAAKARRWIEKLEARN